MSTAAQGQRSYCGNAAGNAWRGMWLLEASQGYFQVTERLPVTAPSAEATQKLLENRLLSAIPELLIGYCTAIPRLAVTVLVAS